MKGKSALFWLGLAGAAGAVLFQTSYEVQDLEETLASVNRSIVAEQEAIQVLKAEWSYLNDPTRLETLARTHLALRPTDARQFLASIDAIPMRPVAPDAGPAPLPPMAGLQAPAAKAASPAPPARTATPATGIIPAKATTGGTTGKAPAPPQQLAPKTLTPPATAKSAPAKPQPAAPAPNDSMGVLIARLGGNR